MNYSIEVVKIKKPEAANIIIGQAHFIKTVEDIYEALAQSVPGCRFGVAFCEASGPCLVRSEGTDESLKKLAVENALSVGCGHTFFILLDGTYPVNVLNAVKGVAEVCGIYCATANPLEVVVAQTACGRGVLGVVDGSPPKGAESAPDVRERKGLLRKIGYKL
jgi:hypothetical protein